MSGKIKAKLAHARFESLAPAQFVFLAIAMFFVMSDRTFAAEFSCKSDGLTRVKIADLVLAIPERYQPEFQISNESPYRILKSSRSREIPEAIRIRVWLPQILTDVPIAFRESLSKLSNFTIQASSGSSPYPWRNFIGPARGRFVRSERGRSYLTHAQILGIGDLIVTSPARATMFSTANAVLSKKASVEVVSLLPAEQLVDDPKPFMVLNELINSFVETAPRR